MSRASIVAYINTRADQHDAAATVKPRNAEYHRGTATLFRALASDIGAKLDVPDLTPPVETAPE